MNSANLEQLEYDRRWGETDEAYGNGVPGYSQNFVRFIEKWTTGSPHGNDRIALDIGCGDGFFSSAISKQGYRIHGIDLSPVAIAKAHERIPDGVFQIHNLTEPLPMKNDSFDLIWCSEVLEHLFSPLYALQECHRVLKPGGRLLATVPAHALLKNLAIALFAFDRHYDPEYPHVRFFTKSTLSGLVSKAGLAPISISTCGSNLGIRDVLFPTNILIVAEKKAK